jgi:hypothetical protein
MRVPGVNLLTTLVVMLALFWASSAMIRWAGRRVRGGSKAAPARSPLKGVDEASARTTIEKLHADSLVSPEQLATMTPRERELLLLTVAAKLKKR